MLKRSAAVVLVASSVAYGAKAAPVYLDAVLKDFHTEQAGMHCSTTGNTNVNFNANTDTNGNTAGTVSRTSSASTNCSPRMVAYYTVVMGAHVWFLTPGRDLG